MSVDKLVDSAQLDSDLTSVANAIRAKSGGSGQLAFPAGFVSEISNIPSGGGTELQSDFFVIHKETITAGANTVTNTQNHYNYLNGAKSIPGTVFAFSLHKKDSYVYNEIGVGTTIYSPSSNGKSCYRYRSGWQQVAYYNSGYDAKLVEGSVIDIFTYEMLNPGT